MLGSVRQIDNHHQQKRSCDECALTPSSASTTLLLAHTCLVIAAALCFLHSSDAVTGRNERKLHSGGHGSFHLSPVGAHRAVTMLLPIPRSDRKPRVSPRTVPLHVFPNRSGWPPRNMLRPPGHRRYVPSQLHLGSESPLGSHGIEVDISPKVFQGKIAAHPNRQRPCGNRQAASQDHSERSHLGHDLVHVQSHRPPTLAWRKR